MSLSLLGRLVARLRVVNLAGRIPMSTTSTKSPTSTEEAVCSLLNTDKLNWDGSLSFECMKRAVSSLELHEKTSMAQALDKIHEGVNIVVTKEMEMDASVIRGLPNSVRLICEAGTGFNNIDCDAAKTRGITVCNVPEYSTEAVATMVMTFVLSFSSSLMQQQLHAERQSIHHASVYNRHFALRRWRITSRMFTIGVVIKVQIHA